MPFKPGALWNGNRNGRPKKVKSQPGRIYKTISPHWQELQDPILLLLAWYCDEYHEYFPSEFQIQVGDAVVQQLGYRHLLSYGNDSRISPLKTRLGEILDNQFIKGNKKLLSCKRIRHSLESCEGWEQYRKELPTQTYAKSYGRLYTK